MSRLLLPLTLSAAAFAFAWWAGRERSVSTGVPRAGEAPVSSARSTAAGDLPDYGFARREALVLSMEKPGPTEIRRLLEGGQLDTTTAYRLANLWASQNPAGFWEWLTHGGKSALSGFDLTELIFNRWFRRDSAAALAAFHAAGPEYRITAARGLLSLVLDDDESLRSKLVPFLDELSAAALGDLYFYEDAPGAVAKLMKLPEGTGRDRLLANAAAVWLEKDWKAVSGLVEGLREPLKSKLMTALAAKAFNASDRTFTETGKAFPGPECFEWLRNWLNTGAPPSLRRELGADFVSTLAATDPAAALEWAQENLSSRPLTQAMAKIMQEESLKDPAAARALVETLPPGGVKQRAAFAAVGKPTAESVTWLIAQADRNTVGEWYQVARNWSFADPEAYKKYLEAAEPGSLPQHLINGGMQNLLLKDAPGTMAWVLSTQTPKTAGTALAEWSQDNVPAAAAWLKDHAAAVEWSPSMAVALSETYFKRSPPEAVEWARTLPEGPLRAATVASLRKALSADSVLKPGERSGLEANLGNP